MRKVPELAQRLFVAALILLLLPLVFCLFVLLCGLTVIKTMIEPKGSDPDFWQD